MSINKIVVGSPNGSARRPGPDRGATGQTGTKTALKMKRSAFSQSTERVMADERWERLVEQQGIAYAKTVAEAMKLKLDMGNPAHREKLRRAVLDLVAGRNMRKQKRPG